MHPLASSLRRLARVAFRGYIAENSTYSQTLAGHTLAEYETAIEEMDSQFNADLQSVINDLVRKRARAETEKEVERLIAEGHLAYTDTHVKAHIDHLKFMDEQVRAKTGEKTD